jgi:hypothetical protein
VNCQRQIVERVTKRREEIARLKADAKTRADVAKADMEAMILGTKLVESTGQEPEQPLPRGNI